MSATIYPFPTGGRASLAATQESTQESKSVTVTPAATPVITACGAAWYHEDAIKEDERTPKK